MKTGKIMNGIGFALVGICFIWSITRIVSRTREAINPDQVVIRFAHWQLESGIGEAFDELGRRYMELHPNVRVEQMRIPERIYKIWLTTQLVGETAPDLIELGRISEEDIARYYMPLMEVISKPNPYNEGTPLEGVPWRDTYIDGMSSAPAYIASLLDYYGIPTALFTVRMYYNAELYRDIAGDTPLPVTYDELIELCDKVHAYASEHNKVIIPIAGSQYNAPQIINRIYTSLTQRMAMELSENYTLEPDSIKVWLGYLKGKWNYHSPPVITALRLMREMGLNMQPGFLSLLRDDAMFYFVQGHALMIASGSWDITSMHSQAPFEISAFPIPLPDPDDPKYSDFTLGALSEAGSSPGAAFSLTRQSKNPEQALDFLRFITSYESSRIFTEISNWLPAIIDVELPERVKPFAPIVEGYPAGVYAWIGGDSSRIYLRNFHILMAHDGSVEMFAKSMDAEMSNALIRDFRVSYAGGKRRWMRNDSLLASTIMAYLADDGKNFASAYRLGSLLESDIGHELNHFWFEKEFDGLGKSLEY